MREERGKLIKNVKLWLQLGSKDTIFSCKIDLFSAWQCNAVKTDNTYETTPWINPYLHNQMQMVTRHIYVAKIFRITKDSTASNKYIPANKWNKTIIVSSYFFFNLTSDNKDKQKILTKRITLQPLQPFLICLLIFLIYSFYSLSQVLKLTVWCYV